MAVDPIHAFYCRKEWLQLAQAAKIKSGGVCAGCGEIFDISELRPHHKIELTLDNIDDVHIALNPDNIEVLCHNCHNLQHNRYGHRVSEKHVYVVYGSPFAGKTTYVETVATRNDVVVDLDKIHQAICVCSKYDKPDATKQIAFHIRDYLYDEIRTATPRRRWQNAYIVGMFYNRYDRDELVKEYGAELIHITTSKDECIKRACETLKQKSLRDAAVGWINSFWERYTE